MLIVYKLSIFYSFITLLLIAANSEIVNGESTIVNAANATTLQQQGSNVDINNATNSNEIKSRRVSKTDQIPRNNADNSNKQVAVNETNAVATKEGTKMLAEGVALSTPELSQTDSSQKAVNKTIDAATENKSAPSITDTKNSPITGTESNNKTAAAPTTTSNETKTTGANNSTQTPSTVLKNNSTIATTVASPATNSVPNKVVNATTTTSTTSSTTTTTTTTSTTTTKAPPTAPPTKPHKTIGLADLPEAEIANANKQSSSSTLPEPEVAPDREPNMESLHSNRDYIVPIVTVMLTVPLAIVVFTMVYRRFRDYWSTRHYRRMDFLLDGMYND